jgi:trk system potassium uptake protein TrkA
MFVMIAGGGRTGARLANLLLNEGYKVRLVENRAPLLARLHQELATEIIYEGNPIDPSVLELAGIREAHALAAVTAEDSSNLALCFLAKTMFDVPRTIAASTTRTMPGCSPPNHGRGLNAVRCAQLT